MRMCQRPRPPRNVSGASRNDAREQHFAGIVQARRLSRQHTGIMTFDSLSVYALSAFVLFSKFVVTISVQARERLRTRAFRYPEDAARWQGVVAPDSDLCQRAAQVLRNDTESQPYYLVLGALLVAFQPDSRAAIFYFATYTLARLAHTYWLLFPRQPHRNRAFSVGLVALVALAGHVAFSLGQRVFA
jgi:glutathione S-transferase